MYWLKVLKYCTIVPQCGLHCTNTSNHQTIQTILVSTDGTVVKSTDITSTEVPTSMKYYYAQLNCLTTYNIPFFNTAFCILYAILEIKYSCTGVQCTKVVLKYETTCSTEVQCTLIVLKYKTTSITEVQYTHPVLKYNIQSSTEVQPKR